MTTLTNFTFDELTIGQQERYTKILTDQDITLFAILTGDTNPVHLDDDFAKTTRFGERVGHGMWIGAIVSAAIATKLPGPGSIYVSQSLKFLRAILPGDEITVQLTVTEKEDKKKTVTMDCRATNQHKKIVLRGTATVLAPTEKTEVKAALLPTLTLTPPNQ